MVSSKNLLHIDTPEWNVFLINPLIFTSITAKYLRAFFNSNVLLRDLRVSRFGGGTVLDN